MYYTTIEAMVKKYDKMTREYAFNATTTEEHSKWQKRAVARLKEISGIDLCEECKLNPKMHSTQQMDGFIKEYWTIETEEDVIMPFYLLKPEIPNKAAVIVPHGHGGCKEGTVANFENPGVAMYKDFYKKDGIAIELVKAGYTVACPDERGSGERREGRQQGEDGSAWNSNSHRELLHAAIGFGQSVIGLAVWDLMRLIDFLQELPEIDAKRIGCAGMSGGGQQTLWLAAIDDRVKAAVTSGYFYGYKEALLRMCANCSCNYIPNMWRTMDMGDMGAMIAPRALLVESGEKDGLNGEPGLDNVYPQVEIARKAFELYGAEDRLVHSVHPGGHQWVGTGVKDFFEANLLV